MTYLRATIIALAFAVFCAAAYQDKDKDKDKEKEKTPMKLKGFLPQGYKKLGLREEQVQKIYKIQADYKEKIDELTKKVDKLKSDRNTEIEKVLTPDQLKALKKIKD